MALQALEISETDFVLHLKGPAHSGRGVKFRLLSPVEKRKVDANAYTLLPKEVKADRENKEDALMSYFELRTLEGVKAFLVAVTDNHSLPSLTPDKSKNEPDPVWHTLTLQELDLATSDYKLDGGKLFTAADIEVLCNVYRNFHEPNQEQVKTALGELIPAV